MPDTPHDRDDSDGAAEPLRAGAMRHGRTAAAGRAFLHALRDDVAALGGELAAQAERRRQSLAMRLRRSPRADAVAPRAALASAWRTGSIAWARAGGRVLRRFGAAIVLVGAGATLAVFGAMLWALNGLPLDGPANQPNQPTVLLEAENGAPLGRVGPFRTADAPLSDFPPILIKAVVSTEDRRFFEHFGVDPLGILRAFHRNMQAGGIEEGGSTITQQLVKTRFGNHERTYTRKMREALTAVWLETHLSKEQILTRYLNAVYLGAGAYGMMAASRLYFDKRPAELTLPEAAMLAGLIKAPTEFNPLAHLDAAQTRAATVLDMMVANGAIDAQAANDAKAHPATTKLTPQLAPARAWFTDWVAPQAAALAGAQGHARVRTTLRPDLQRIAQDTLDQVLATQGGRRHASQGALVAMRPDGAVLAMVGGRDYGASQFNRAVEANRQPGSSFKLFVYLTALRKGYSPQDTVDASPIDIEGWEPENYGDEHYGRLSLAEAFARSVNTAAVHLAMDVGLTNVIATARDLGIDTPISATPSLALGAYGVNLLEMTGAFASVRADRMHIQPWGIAAVGDDDAAMRSAAPAAPTQTLDPYQGPMIDLLRGVVEHGTGRGAAVNGFAAGKTGTSQDFRDAWFIGFTDNLVVGVWVGNDDNSPMRHVVGGSLPATIWRQFVTAATPILGQDGTVALAPGNPAPSDDTTAAPAGDQAAQADQPSGACDQQACAGTYHSFRASDCTYQPYFGGGRRQCDIGTRAAGPPAQTSQATSQSTTGAGSQGAQQGTPAQCNVDACARFYSSFNPSDCTYQPFGGGARQLCEK